MAAARREPAEEEERLALVRARLAAEEREALEAIKGDLCQWLGKPDVLALDVMPASFLRALDSGAPLCNLAGLVQEGARRFKASGRMLSVQVPMAPLTCQSIKAKRDTAMFRACARDNAAQFIEWCRALGVGEAVIFESVGLVEHKDERRVILCLLDVARFAEKVGITPPQLVALEKEIEQLESEPASHGDEEVGEKGEISPHEKDDAVCSDQHHEEGGVEAETNTETGEVEGKEKDVSSCKATSEGREDESEEEPPAKRVKRVSNTRIPSPNKSPPPHSHHSRRKQPTHQRRISQRNKRRQPVEAKEESTGKKETVDEKVMRCMHECTCKQTLQVQNCGKGKFTVGGKTTVYARMLSDRVMVRVGGGWETLEHFILKHDPCRLDKLTTLNIDAAKKSSKTPSKNLRKRGREL